MTVDIKRVSALLNIAARAIEVERASSEVSTAKQRLRAAYNGWKYRNGIEHVERDTLEWITMMANTKTEHVEVEKAKRRAYNASRRLRTAISKYQEAP